VWGASDPYLPTSFGEANADALGGPTRLELVEDAGHWPWIDRPEVVDTITDFLLASG
jgi:pimeloyl-ACP methyl ester carboxylesterase